MAVTAVLALCFVIIADEQPIGFCSIVAVLMVLTTLLTIQFLRSLGNQKAEKRGKKRKPKS